MKVYTIMRSPFYVVGDATSHQPLATSNYLPFLHSGQ